MHRSNAGLWQGVPEMENSIRTTNPQLGNNVNQTNVSNQTNQTNTIIGSATIDDGTDTVIGDDDIVSVGSFGSLSSINSANNIDDADSINSQATVLMSRSYTGSPPYPNWPSLRPNSPLPNNPENLRTANSPNSDYISESDSDETKMDEPPYLRI